ncbi:hypothetical protein OROGR_015557 [Orobanche gracilis]
MKIQIIISFVLFTLTFPHTNARSQQEDQTLIETTCNHTTKYQLCLDTIRADPKSAGADLAGLGLIVIEAIKKKSKLALSATKRLLRRHPELAKPLQECADVYKAVIKADYPVAVQAIRGNPKFAENGIADVAVEAEYCEGAFKGVAKSPLTAENDAVKNLAVVARAIIRNLL